MRRSPVMTMMIRAAEKAGRAVVRDFGEVEHLQASMKGPRDFVEIAEQKAERVLREELQKARPRFGLVIGEADEVVGADTSHRFIADPIGGRTNFLHGIPHFAVSIALEESREVVAGVIFNPINDELFWAERNIGAYLHERRLRVSRRNSLADALIAGSAYAPDSRDFDAWAALSRRLSRATALRVQGSAALDLAYVAAGRLDGYVDLGQQPWRVAAGGAILKEAGGRITDFSGGGRWLTDGEIVATSNDLYAPLLQVAAAA